MTKSLAVIHLNPEPFVSHLGPHIYENFGLVMLNACDLRKNSAMCESVGWSIRLKPAVVIIGVPDDSDQSVKNVKASYEWLLSNEIPTIFVFPTQTPVERLLEISTTKDVKLLTTEEFGHCHLGQFIEDYIRIFHSSLDPLDAEYLN